jgi:hypothetical protein
MRNSSLDSNNYFSNEAGQELGDFKRHEYGGAVGGPIAKDKTFYFLNVEKRYERSAVLRRLTVPTELEQAADFSQSLNAAGQMRVIHDPFTTVADPARAGRF